MIVDTDDERIRQQLGRFLVEEKGYAKADLVVRQKIDTLFGGLFVVSKIDFLIKLQDCFVILIRYGPGSLVTRERAAIAAARVFDKDRQIPWAVVTNGRDAELLDVYTKKIIGTGMAVIPGKEEALALLGSLEFRLPLDDDRRNREFRILNAYDHEICCAGNACPLPGARQG